QRRGYVLSHVLDCPLAPLNASKLLEALDKRLHTAMTRIRRSFKPKRVVLMGHELDPFVQRLKQADLGVELVLSKTGQGLEINELANVCKVTPVTATNTASL